MSVPQQPVAPDDRPPDNRPPAAVPSGGALLAPPASDSSDLVLLPDERPSLTPAAGSRPGWSALRLGVFGCCSLSALLLVASAAIVIALIVAAGGAVGSLVPALTGGGAAVLFPQPQVTLLTSPVVFTNLAQAGRGRLETVEYEFDRLQVRVNVDGCVANSCFHYAVYSLTGAVEAGVDLAGFAPDDVVIDQAAERVTVRLPQPNLTSCRIDQIVQQLTGGNLTQADFGRTASFASYQTLIDGRDEALDEGAIIARAEAETRAILLPIIAALPGADGYTVEIVFDADAPTPLHPTCSPAPPPGYTFNPATNSWVPNA